MFLVAVTMMEQLQLMPSGAQIPYSIQLIVGIHFNQATDGKITNWSVPPLKLGALWVFGSCSPDQRRWCIIGDLLKENTSIVEFPYPEPILDEKGNPITIAQFKAM